MFSANFNLVKIRFVVRTPTIEVCKNGNFRLFVFFIKTYKEHIYREWVLNQIVEGPKAYFLQEYKNFFGCRFLGTDFHKCL